MAKNIVISSLALSILWAMVPCQAAEVSVVIDYPSISPNGDGVRDSSAVEVVLSKAFYYLHVTLENTERTDTLNTFISVAGPDSGSYSALWSGVDSLNNPLADSEYLLHVAAAAADTTVDITRSLIVDTVSPVIHIDMIEPGFFSPNDQDTGGKLLVHYTVSDFGNGDEARAIITGPDDFSDTVDLPVDADSAYTMEWEPGDISSGIYYIKLLIEDTAGNNSYDQGNVTVDTDPPEIFIITSVPKSSTAPPGEISGSCYDPAGVDSLRFTWQGSYDIPPSEVYAAGDTTFWTVDILDSIYVEGEYVEGNYALSVRAYDFFGQMRDEAINFKIDLTPPQAPAISEPDSPVMLPDLVISYSGEIDADADTVRFYRVYEGDTSTSWVFRLNAEPTVQLQEGLNEIWATAIDEAGNESPQSNHISVVYDTSARSEFPEAFRGPDLFRITASRTAIKATVDIFDLSGEKVVKLKEFGPSEYFEMEWNLLNSDGEEVRNGAYLAIITVFYDNGKSAEKYFIAVVR